ncbi:MAG: sugar transferase [Proteobacteria bacterium]|nr:MAG: sugar transferase [Pseudomonadota bacterium]
MLELALAGALLSAAFAAVVAGRFPPPFASAGLTTVAALVFALVQIICLSALGLHRHERGRPVASLAVKLATSSLVGAGLCYLIFDALPGRDLYREAIPDAVILGAIGLGALRMILASRLHEDLLSHRVLVLGTGLDAEAVERAFRFSAESGVRLVGFYPIDGSEPTVVSPERVLSETSPLEETVSRLRVHEVIVAVREQRGGLLPLAQLLNCRLRGIRITDLSGFFERSTGQVPVDSLKASWLIYGSGFRQGRARHLVKRTFDILAATALLIVALPVIFATAIAVLLESGRPIIFRQERVGLGGRTFTLLKFRSMSPDAERDGVPRWASRGDSRITKVGQFIRRTRIDELPQLVNVLKGEMSFVGPRPERPYFVSQLSEKVPFYSARHTVKPGVTGWAQVHYSYGASVEEAAQKLQFDLYYVKNHTLILDLLILIRTIRVVLLRQGAR